jgi:hypothetical protein
MKNEQAWFDETQRIVCEFVQNDNELGELMLDHSPHYWEECFDKGFTPQAALNGFFKILEQSDLLARFKAYQSRISSTKGSRRNGP